MADPGRNIGTELTDADKHLLDMLKRELRRNLPSGRQITRQAIAELCFPDGCPLEDVKARFSELVNSVQLRAYELYLASEGPAGGAAFRNVLRPLLPPEATADDLIALLETHFRALDKMFLGLTQGRRPRAGNAFETIVSELFSAMGYPYTPQPSIDGRPDFVLPSIDHYRRFPLDCIVFTLKRSLRERWSQIITEGTRGLGFYLGTIDDSLTAEQLARMATHRIYVVVPADVKARCYQTTPNAISFEMFFEHHLDPAVRRWVASGVASREPQMSLEHADGEADASDA